MDYHPTKIEFRYHPNQTDIDDLSQECTAYLKTKQFMANRIYQQQEEIEMLKQNVIFHSGKHIQMHEMLKNITEQIEMIKPGVNNITNNVQNFKQDDPIEVIGTNLEDSNDFVVSGDINTSFVFGEKSDNSSNNYDNHYVNLNNKHIKDLADISKDKKNSELEGKENFLISNNDIKSSVKCNQMILVRNENIDLKKEMEKLKILLLENTLELNKVKTDKFILFNELNELIQSLRRVDLDKLNNFVKTNSSVKNLNKFEMPSAKGLKYNVLSAQCQLGKIIKSDLTTKKLNRIEEDHLMKNEDKYEKEDNERNNKNYVNSKIFQLETYLNLLKKTEEEFDALLDRKLAKRSKSFNLY